MLRLSIRALGLPARAKLRLMPFWVSSINLTLMKRGTVVVEGVEVGVVGVEAAAVRTTRAEKP
jgi:hypothetical protein